MRYYSSPLRRACFALIEGRDIDEECKYEGFICDTVNQNYKQASFWNHIRQMLQYWENGHNFSYGILQWIMFYFSLSGTLRKVWFMILIVPCNNGMPPLWPLDIEVLKTYLKDLGQPLELKMARLSDNICKGDAFARDFLIWDKKLLNGRYLHLLSRRLNYNGISLAYKKRERKTTESPYGVSWNGAGMMRMAGIARNNGRAIDEILCRKGKGESICCQEWWMAMKEMRIQEW